MNKEKLTITEFKQGYKKFKDYIKFINLAVPRFNINKNKVSSIFKKSRKTVSSSNDNYPLFKFSTKDLLINSSEQNDKQVLKKNKS